MFTHDQIWAAIDRLAGSRGLSASGLAKQAGLDPTAFNKSKRISPNGKPRWPSTESLSKILAVTECTMTDLLDLMDQEGHAVRTVPVLSFANVKAGKIKDKSKTTMVIAFDTGEQSFAVAMEDDRLSPLFRAGSMLIADIKAKIKKEDRVLVYSKSTGLKGGIVQAVDKKSLSLLAAGNSKEINFTDSDIEWVARILWASQ